MYWIFISTTFFFVLTEESDDEFIFHSEEEEDFGRYAELYEDELSVSRKGSINFWWLLIICREGYFFTIWSILLFVTVSCFFTKLLLLLLAFLLWVFILLSVLSNFFEYRFCILNRDRENSESDELLSLEVLLVMGFRTVTIFVGSVMYESLLSLSAKERFIFFLFGCWLLKDESESVDISTDEDEVCWLHIAVSFWILVVVLLLSVSNSF